MMPGYPGAWLEESQHLALREGEGCPSEKGQRWAQWRGCSPKVTVSRSVVSDSVTPWTVARRAPLPMGIFRARTLEWVAMPISREIFPTQGLNPGLLHCRHILYPLGRQGSRARASGAHSSCVPRVSGLCYRSQTPATSPRGDKQAAAEPPPPPAPRRIPLPEACLEGETISFAGAREEQRPLQQLGNKIPANQTPAGPQAGGRDGQPCCPGRLVPAHGSVPRPPPSLQKVPAGHWPGDHPKLPPNSSFYCLLLSAPLHLN